MPLCFLKMEARQLEPTGWQCLQDSCSFFCLFSNLAASPLSSWAEFKSWLPSGPNLRPAFPMSNMLWVQQQSLCAWGTHSLARSPSGTGVVDPCRQSHQPALRDAANPLLWARIYSFSTSSEWSGCFCLPSSLSPGFHPNKRRKETEKAVRQGSGKREFLINSFSQVPFLFETIPIPVFITKHFSFDKCLFNFI